LLRFGLGRDEPHGWARRRLADRLGVYEVVLVALDEGPHELRRDEFDLMPEGAQFAGHVLGTGAGFHDDSAGMEGSEKLDELFAAGLLAEHGFAVLILAVELK